MDLGFRVSGLWIALTIFVAPCCGRVSSLGCTGQIVATPPDITANGGLDWAESQDGLISGFATARIPELYTPEKDSESLYHEPFGPRRVSKLSCEGQNAQSVTNVLGSKSAIIIPEESRVYE